VVVLVVDSALRHTIVDLLRPGGRTVHAVDLENHGLFAARCPDRFISQKR
jgi:hypothetical protein